MALSKSKAEKVARAKRLAKVQKEYPHYPFWVLDAHKEYRIREYIDGKRKDWR